MDGLLKIMFIFIFLPFLFFNVILPVVAEWKIFGKAGEPEWICLIPIYSSYMMYKIAWKPQYFLIYMGAYVFVIILLFLNLPTALLSFFVLAISLAYTALQFIFSLKLASVFHHSYLFGVGLFFFTPIFKLILAFDSSEYQGTSIP